MKRTLLGLITLLAAALSGRAQLGTPYVTDGLNSSSQSAKNWKINGSVASEDNNGLGVTSAAGASFVSSVAVPDGSSQYQITFQINASAGRAISSISKPPHMLCSI